MTMPRLAELDEELRSRLQEAMDSVNDANEEMYGQIRNTNYAKIRAAGALSNLEASAYLDSSSAFLQEANRMNAEGCEIDEYLEAIAAQRRCLVGVRESVVRYEQAIASLEEFWRDMAEKR